MSYDDFESGLALCLTVLEIKHPAHGAELVHEILVATLKRRNGARDWRAPEDMLVHVLKEAQNHLTEST